MNVQDTLPLLLRMLDAEEMAKYECMTPTTLDHLSSYRDGVDQLEFYIDTYGDDTHRRPTMFFPGAAIGNPANAALFTGANDFQGTRPRAFNSYPNNVLAYDKHRPAGSSWYHKPRGSFKLEALYSINGETGAKQRPLITDNVVYARFKVTEPLLISPFVFGHPDGKQGFYGIQTMNFQMNIAANASRAWRAASFLGQDGINPFTKSATIESFENSQLLFQFLTPHASDLLEPRNVVPYYELPIYRTSNFSSIPSIGFGKQQNDGTYTGGNALATVTLSSSNIQLNCVPDKLIICVRRQIAGLNCSDTDSYLTINNISINWNNQAGLLSSMSPEMLYRSSILSGLSNLTWDEFCGQTVHSGNPSSNTSDPIGPYMGEGSNNGANRTSGIRLVPTTGSILVLNFAEVIQLTEEYYAPGSLGSFNLQLTVNATNNHAYEWNGANIEMIIMPMLSGVFVNEKGTSSTFISLLTKEDVIQASQQEPYTNFEMRRLIGGNFLNSLKSAAGWISSKLPMVKNVLNNIPHAYAQTGAKVLDALGYGKGAKLMDRLQ
jgi:hypothetical protein